MKTRRSPLVVLLVCLTLLPVFAVNAQSTRSHTQAMASIPGWRSVWTRGVVDLPRTGQATTYASGDDGALQLGMEWPVPRFVDNQDGTVTDLLTGLMWTKNANLSGGRLNWWDALAHVAAMNRGEHENFGYTDWRMPNIVEIESLVHAGQSNGAIWLNNQGFTNVPESNWWSDFYWSSSGGGNWRRELCEDHLVRWRGHHWHVDGIYWVALACSL